MSYFKYKDIDEDIMADCEISSVNLYFVLEKGFLRMHINVKVFNPLDKYFDSLLQERVINTGVSNLRELIGRTYAIDSYDEKSELEIKEIDLKKRKAVIKWSGIIIDSYDEMEKSYFFETEFETSIPRYIPRKTVIVIDAYKSLIGKGDDIEIELLNFKDIENSYKKRLFKKKDEPDADILEFKIKYEGKIYFGKVLNLNGEIDDSIKNKYHNKIFAKLSALLNYYQIEIDDGLELEVTLDDWYRDVSLQKQEFIFKFSFLTKVRKEVENEVHCKI